MLKTLLSKWEKEEVFVQQVVIAAELLKVEPGNRRSLLYRLNEVVVLDTDTIRTIMMNMEKARRDFLVTTDKSSSMLEFLGMIPELSPILQIDDAYLDYAKTLRSHVSKFIITEGR